LPGSAIARDLDSSQRLKHLDQRLLAGSRDICGSDDRDGLHGLGSSLRQAACGDDNGVVCVLSERTARRKRDA
jgi:hypothetical protein